MIINLDIIHNHAKQDPYIMQAMQTKSDQFNFTPTLQHCDMLHAAMGITTEAGELLDALKKAIFYGKPLDVVNLKEELGDLMWYIAIACHSLSISIEQVCNMNIAKLRARYPEKFTSHDAVNRDTNKEIQAMTAGAE